METYNNDPNFSIVMQGGCNANCKFCFNKEQGKKDKCSRIDFIANLLDTLRVLPNQFYQISITGNEPMLSPMIDDVLGICKRVKQRYTNILLTTNGTNLLENSDSVIAGVHHINVSRHHYDYGENKKIFGGTWDVTDEDLEKIIDTYGKSGVDVSLNCVINDNTSVEFIDKYIDYAKRIGAFAVRFRKENGTLENTPVENVFAKEYPIVWHGTCPVCRTDLRVIRGLKTFWKSSVLEPSDTITDKVFELVYDTNGKVYKDWSRKKPYDVTGQSLHEEYSKFFKLFNIEYNRFNSCGGSNSCGGHSNSCGGRSYNSCGGSSSRC